jgi:hypothetical protein
MRLAHDWELRETSETPKGLVRDFIRPAVRAVPGAMAVRLGSCRLSLPLRLGSPDLSSQWSETEAGLEIAVARAEMAPHDIAMEFLICLGETLWERAAAPELASYLKLLQSEIDAGVTGEIDEEALHEKEALLSSRTLARSRRQLERYARASYASTAAEYVHCLWHDVTVRSGPEYLPPVPLRRRLELMESWFSPNRGYRLFPTTASACVRLRNATGN